MALRTRPLVGSKKGGLKKPEEKPTCRWGHCRETRGLTIVCMDMGAYRQPCLVCERCKEDNDRHGWRGDVPRSSGSYRLFADKGKGGRTVFA